MKFLGGGDKMSVEQYASGWETLVSFSYQFRMIIYLVVYSSLMTGGPLAQLMYWKPTI
jgi:hypothetical protein